MKYRYLGLDDEFYEEELVTRDIAGMLLHATPDDRVAEIKEHGLRCVAARNKQLTDIPAIFCSLPGTKPSTNDLFRYYGDWSIVVIDTDQLPNHVWYEDFLAADEMRIRQRPNNHVMTFMDIPSSAIKKVIK